MEKKVIIFDLDDTLRRLEYNYDHKKIINVRLRPNINELLKKLKEAKKNGIDVIIYTTASKESAEKYFIEQLPEEYRDVFCRIISKESLIQPKDGSKEQRVYGYMTANKPVTAMEEYDQILFFDDNRREGNLLREMYRNPNDSPEKQVIFTNCWYKAPDPMRMYVYKKIAECNNKIAIEVNKYFEILLEEPGCKLMIERIDEFQKAEHKNGLTMYEMEEQMTQYRKNVFMVMSKIIELINQNPELTEKFNEFQMQYIEYTGSENIKDNDITR